MKLYKATLAKNVVSDDTIERLDGGYYKGHNGASVCVYYNTFLNEWQDEQHVKFFKTVENALEWYAKQFGVRAVEFQRDEIDEEAKGMSEEAILEDWKDAIKLVLEA